jgi:hypothetical protein
MGQQSATDLQVPQSVEAYSFRAIESVLRNDPVLSPLVRHWGTLRDNQTDFVTPEWSLCPYLRLSIGPVAADWVTELEHVGGFALNFHMAVQGWNIDNLFNFWGVIRRAIFPIDNNAAALIQQKIRGSNPYEGVTKPRIRQMVGYAPADGDEIGRGMYLGQGVIEFPMLIRT